MGNLAIITARSGSKGLKDKNIKPLKGKPLLAYSIEAARKSGLFEEVYVSTDSEKYAEIAKEYGADVPFLREKENANDTASSLDTVQEALNKYKEMGREFDTVCLLQPTSPLRQPEDICAGYELLQKKNARAVIGVTETDHSPLWCGVLPENGNLENFISKETLAKPRQQLPTYYRINGALYIFQRESFSPKMNLYEADCFAYVMPKERSIDIDDEMDFQMAEFLMK